MDALGTHMCEKSNARCFIKCLAPLWLPSALLFFGSNTSAFSNSRSRLTFAHLAKDAGSGNGVRIGAMPVVEFISSSAHVQCGQKILILDG